MYQGDWDRAEEEARAVHETGRSPGQSIFPANTVLGRIAARRGNFDEAETIFGRAWKPALATGEWQRIQPMAGIKVELEWLRGQPEAGIAATTDLWELEERVNGNPFETGEVALWRARAGLAPTLDGIAEPYRLHLEGRFGEAARAWEELGQPYEAADAMADSSDPALLGEAIASFDRLGAVSEQRAQRRLGQLTRTRRRLTTLLFTDLVSSTQRAARLGDAAWRKMLDEHHRAAERVVTEHGGTVVGTPSTSRRPPSTPHSGCEHGCCTMASPCAQPSTPARSNRPMVISRDWRSISRAARRRGR
jgi:hypothetical protein